MGLCGGADEFGDLAERDHLALDADLVIEPDRICPRGDAERHNDGGDQDDHDPAEGGAGGLFGLKI